MLKNKLLLLLSVQLGVAQCGSAPETWHFNVPHKNVTQR